MSKAILGKFYQTEKAIIKDFEKGKIKKSEKVLEFSNGYLVVSNKQYEELKFFHN